MSVRRTIRSLLVANRGEIAVRVIRTAREMGIRTIAVYSEADRESPHVQLADEAHGIGPPQSALSYLNIEKIIAVARSASADAIHPGYGFLSENPDFARRVEEAGLIFVGPPSGAIEAMGDKTRARALMQAAGVPTVPGSDGPVRDVDAALAFCTAQGFPALLKAAAGGGGKGMRIVRNPAELAQAFAAARSEARSAFGDDRVYVEKYLDGPRHIEFQIIADDAGTVLHLGERECSIQRRHQKVVEESPSVVLDDDLRRRMGETAVTAARACGYRNAGTIEFLVDAERRFYFLEMNTRLQVEHPVTEQRTGFDLVALQLRVATGEPLGLRQEHITFRGHAIECRICAEDPANGFLPSTGAIRHLRSPSGPGVRNDSGMQQGGEVSLFYDPLLAKLIAWGATRDEAIGRMMRALSEYEILGVATNLAFCRFVLGHESFRRGEFDTHFVEKHFRADLLPQPEDHEERAAAILCALLEADGAAGSPRPGDGGAEPVSRWRDRRKEFRGRAGQ